MTAQRQAERALLDLMPMLHAVTAADFAFNAGQVKEAAMRMREAFQAYRELDVHSPARTTYLLWLCDVEGVSDAE